VIARDVVPESPFPSARTALTAAIIFVITHLLLLIGVSAPEKFYFDEVHYVPAARQMLEPAMREPMLNRCIRRSPNS
jgi:dolichyl-phosphate-mannose-protein mannosyltransferase